MASDLERLARAILRDRALAADAVQDAFRLLTQKQDQIDWNHVEGWIIRTVQNVSRNLRRQQERSLVDSEIVGRNLVTDSPSQQAEEQETLESVRREIESLPVEQAEIVRLRLAKGTSFREISEQLGLPLGTVLSRMRLALEKLRKSLNHDQREDE